jgi:hypothetical protein
VRVPADWACSPAPLRGGRGPDFANPASF